MSFERVITSFPRSSLLARAVLPCSGAIQDVSLSLSCSSEPCVWYRKQSADDRNHLYRSKLSKLSLDLWDKNLSSASTRQEIHFMCLWCNMHGWFRFTNSWKDFRARGSLADRLLIPWLFSIGTQNKENPSINGMIIHYIMRRFRKTKTIKILYGSYEKTKRKVEKH